MRKEIQLSNKYAFVNQDLNLHSTEAKILNLGVELAGMIALPVAAAIMFSPTALLLVIATAPIAYFSDVFNIRRMRQFAAKRKFAKQLNNLGVSLNAKEKRKLYKRGKDFSLDKNGYKISVEVDDKNVLRAKALMNSSGELMSMLSNARQLERGLNTLERIAKETHFVYDNPTELQQEAMAISEQINRSITSETDQNWHWRSMNTEFTGAKNRELYAGLRKIVAEDLEKKIAQRLAS